MRLRDGRHCGSFVRIETERDDSEVLPGSESQNAKSLSQAVQRHRAQGRAHQVNRRENHRLAVKIS